MPGVDEVRIGGERDVTNWTDRVDRVSAYVPVVDLSGKVIALECACAADRATRRNRHRDACRPDLMQRVDRTAQRVVLRTWGPIAPRGRAEERAETMSPREEISVAG